MTEKTRLTILREDDPVIDAESAMKLLGPPTFPNGKHHVSFSEVKDWIECSWRHKKKHIEKIELDGPSIHTEFGQVVHDAMEHYIMLAPEDRKPIDAAPYVKEFRSRIPPLIAKMTDEKKAAKTTKDIDAFAAEMPPLLANATVWLDEQFPGWIAVGAELKLYEPIKGQDIRFKGFVDGVLKVPKRRKKRTKHQNNGQLRLDCMMDDSADTYELVEGKFDYWILDWKGQRLTAPIATPSGWTTMGSLKIGQEIIGSTGKPTKVIGIYPLGKRDVYRVNFRNGTFVDCTDDHLWQVHRSEASIKHKVMSTKDLISEKKYVYIPVMSGPVEYNKQQKDLAIEPYTLGALLGDGSFRDNVVKISTADQEILSLMSEAGCEFGYTLRQENLITANVLKVKRKVASLGLGSLYSHQKFIPPEYKMSSPESRLALLQGLLDTDGWTQKGVAKLSTTSKRLAEDAREVVHSLGGVTFMSIRPIRKGANHEEHIVTVRLPAGLAPFRISRKLHSWNPEPNHKLKHKIASIEIVGKDEMQCIKVEAEDSLYVTNDFIVTHNTTSWGWPAKKKRDATQQLQIMLYKIFGCQALGMDLKDTKCGFVLLKRTPRKSDGSHCELIPISVGPKAQARTMKQLHSMINQVKQKRAIKNRMSCLWCRYKNTEHCL